MSDRKDNKYISELDVYLHPTIEEKYRCGWNDVKEITYTAGTSGVEYIVKYENGKQLQFRGNIGYKATWVKKT